MHTSILSRSAIAVASLAVVSVALSAVPASADTPSGVTRQTVLGAAANERGLLSFGDDADARTLVEAVCKIGSDADPYIYVQPADQPGGVDGVLVQAFAEGTETTPFQFCTFAAFAATQTLSTMSGTATISVEEQTSEISAAASRTFPLSGDVYVTAPIEDDEFIGYGIATASGEVSTTSASTTTTSRVVTPKTTQQKKAARKTYDRRVASAKKAYSKSKAKAGSSPSRKASAKRAYDAKRKAAKVAYRKATAGTLSIVVTETPTITKAPFTVTTEGSPR